MRALSSLPTSSRLGTYLTPCVKVPSARSRIARHHAAFPGTNGQVSFIQIDPNTGNITGLFASNPDGSSAIQLTNLEALGSDWSPDGSLVAFDYYDGFNSQIGLVNANGTGFTPLTTDDSVFHGEPAWSPDGTKIAIESDDGNFPSGEGIYLIDPSTGAFLLRLTANPYGQGDIDPRWSPDGKWVVFTRVKQAAPGPKHNRNYPSVAASFLVHPDGTGLRQLTDWGLNATATDRSECWRTIEPFHKAQACGKAV
jgi:dipeptidyl aminopeptidase/acylaminoacyl peptidase